MGRSCGRVLKTVCRALVFASFIGFFIVIDHEIVPSSTGGISSTSTNTRTISTKPATKSGSLKSLEVIGSIDTDPVVNSNNLDHPSNYMMSKRRVPKGSDPIHNRRAGKSKQPPGRA